MGQRTFILAALPLVLCLLAALVGCRRPATAKGRPPTVASLVPAATDLLIGMGATDHLVAVSTWDTHRPETQGLPHVGDYHNTDWERIAALRPQVMIIEMDPGKLSPGFRQRADDLGITLINIQIHRLDDVYAAIEALGKAAGEPAKAAALEKTTRDRIEAVRRRVADQPPVPALIVLDEAGRGVCGPQNFMDDLLTVAGGANVAGSLGKDYPSIDPEQLLKLNPQVILQLLPDATPQVVAQAKRFWEKVPTVPAVRDSRVSIMTDSWAMLPGMHVADLAERFAEQLHPTHAPATSQAAASTPTRPEVSR